MSDKTVITDDDLIVLACDFKSSSMQCGVLVDDFDYIGFARAVLAASEDRRDAERYRWLRQFPTHFGTPVWGIYGAGLPLDRVFIDRAQRLDDAIDAAIAAAGNHKVEG